MELKEKLQRMYGVEKIKVIENDGKRYVESGFMYWLFDYISGVEDALKRLKAELEWNETADKIMEESDGTGKN